MDFADAELEYQRDGSVVGVLPLDRFDEPLRLASVALFALSACPFDRFAAVFLLHVDTLLRRRRRPARL